MLPSTQGNTLISYASEQGYNQRREQVLGLLWLAVVVADTFPYHWAHNGSVPQGRASRSARTAV